MPVKLIQPTASAYSYPLLIKHLLPRADDARSKQEIVYPDLRRRTYREFREHMAGSPAGLRRSATRRCSRGDGMGQRPLSRVLFRGADDGRHPADGQRRPDAWMCNRLYPQ